MKKFTVEYKDFMYENLDDKVSEKLSNNYMSLKRGILILLEDSIDDTTELVNVQNFINDFTESSEKNTLVGFIDNADVFDFYLKYQSNIDEVCNDKQYFDNVPKDNNIFSLYDYVIEGSKFAVNDVLTIMAGEIF